MRSLLRVHLLLWLAVITWAQQRDVGVLEVFAVPSGTCAANSPVRLLASTPAQYVCKLATITSLTGTWTLLASGGGGGPGTVTSVGFAAMPGTVTGSPITTAGSINYSFTAANVVSLFSGCSGTQYLGADAACHSAASGVTSVALSSNLGTVSGSPVTTTGTLTLTGASADIIALFSGCSGTEYLGADGACHTAAAGTGFLDGPCILSGGTDYLAPFFDPVTATASSHSWTFANQHGATNTASGCAQIVSQFSITTDEMNVIYTSPPGANFTEVVAFRAQQDTNVAVQASLGTGACMYESGTGKAVMYTVTPTRGTSLIRANGVVTAGPTQAGISVPKFEDQVQPWIWVWLKLQYDGTNVIASFSWDSGATWTQVDSNMATMFFTTAPDKACFGVRPGGGHIAGTVAGFTMTSP